jgi:hypothetical protein
MPGVSAFMLSPLPAHLRNNITASRFHSRKKRFDLLLSLSRHLKNDIHVAASARSLAKRRGFLSRGAVTCVAAASADVTRSLLVTLSAPRLLARCLETQRGGKRRFQATLALLSRANFISAAHGRRGVYHEQARCLLGRLAA